MAGARVGWVPRTGSSALPPPHRGVMVALHFERSFGYRPSNVAGALAKREFFENVKAKWYPTIFLQLA